MTTSVLTAMYFNIRHWSWNYRGLNLAGAREAGSVGVGEAIVL